ncbi:MAG TPA: glycosyltransferase [Abditibacteriaceae bacterium]|nr:glycosyltransferase [Abditibacteriaceae bacterium]
MADNSTESPLVSIIVPVFNGAQFLRESLDSIVAQTYPRLEITVMDDASTDSTPDIIASYGDRVQCHRQPQNRGIYANMNDGIALARGEYIAIYHADDVYDPSIVEREVAFLQRHPEAGAVFCKDIFIDSTGRELGQLELPPEVRGGRPLDYRIIFNALLTHKNRILRCPSCMVATAVYHDVGTYRQQEFFNTSDVEMYLRIARQYPVGILEEHLFRYRRGHGNSGQRYRHLRTDQERFFKIMDLYLKQGGRAVATPEALSAYEAHRAEDGLMRVVSHYILGHGQEAGAVLRQVRPHRLLASARIQRGRLLVLYLALQFLTRLPRISFLADLFYRRWHDKGDGKESVVPSPGAGDAVPPSSRKGFQP